MEEYNNKVELLRKDADKMENTFIDSKALKMMQRMGYQKGQGLGKNAQGITLPIQIDTQLGHRGLGLKLDNLQSSDEQWDFSKDEICAEETVNWLENTYDAAYVLQIEENWSVEGAPQNDIANESDFCDTAALNNVIIGKNIFKELDLRELNQARSKSNPFETIRSVFFMNRAALKMANIDAATDFMFTSIDTHKDHADHKGPFYFADVCAGPGGFTEYILWRKQWMFKGFGLTLRDENDFRLNDSTCASSATFQALYGARGDGDVCCPDNIRDFKQKVLHETDGKGVHFMMSDGGFSVEGQENLQEILSKNIYIAQCLVALEILRPHGHFVTKLFDLFTQFSVGLLFLMYLCFEKVAIFKPNSSRPANSERYFICSNRIENEERINTIRSYLKNIVRRLWSLKHNNEIDIIEIVPLEYLKQQTHFFSYVYQSNNKIATRQATSLQKLAVFCRNPLNIDARQSELRGKCLKYWQIPDRARPPTTKLSIDELLNESFDKPELVLVQPRQISNIGNLLATISDISDWHFALMQCTMLNNFCNFYAGLSMSRTYRLQANKWVRVKNMQLVQGTLLYGEFVKEDCILKSLNTTKQKYCLHVIDALRLGDVSLANMKFHERQELIRIYCKAVNQEYRPNTIRIRHKTVDKLANFVVYPSLPIIGIDALSESYRVNSILLLKTNELQSFYSTYVLRLQIFFTNGITIEILKKVLNSLKNN